MMSCESDFFAVTTAGAATASRVPAAVVERNWRRDSEAKGDGWDMGARFSLRRSRDSGYMSAPRSSNVAVPHCTDFIDTGRPGGESFFLVNHAKRGMPNRTRRWPQGRYPLARSRQGWEVHPQSVDEMNGIRRMMPVSTS